jgi:hypothetical protein
MEAIDYLDLEEECPTCGGVMNHTGNGTFSIDTYAVEWKCSKCSGEWIETYDGKMSNFIPIKEGVRKQNARPTKNGRCDKSTRVKTKRHF